MPKTMKRGGARRRQPNPLSAVEAAVNDILHEAFARADKMGHPDGGNFLLTAAGGFLIAAIGIRSRSTFDQVVPDIEKAIRQVARKHGVELDSEPAIYRPKR